MQQMHLKQPGFTYSTWGPFTKNKDRIQKFKETGDKSFIYKNQLDKGCFQHDMKYGDFKDLARRTASDKVLRDKAFNIAQNPRYDGYWWGIGSVYNFFDKKSASLSDKPLWGSGVNTHENDKIKQSQHPLDLATHQSAEELHKPIIRKFEKRTVYSRFRDNIWVADLADMQLSSKLNKGLRFLLRAIDIFSKYAWSVYLKDKKGVSIVDAFQKILDKSGRKPNNILDDKGSRFYKNSFKYG